MNAETFWKLALLLLGLNLVLNYGLFLSGSLSDLAVGIVLALLIIGFYLKKHAVFWLNLILGIGGLILGIILLMTIFSNDLPVVLFAQNFVPSSDFIPLLLIESAMYLLVIIRIFCIWKSKPVFDKAVEMKVDKEMAERATLKKEKSFPKP